MTTTKRVWTTKDGQTIRVRDMKDSHIRNVLAYFRKRAETSMLRDAVMLSSYADQAPDGAAMAAEMEVEHLALMDADEYLCEAVGGYKYVLAEAHRRKLEPVIWEGER